MLRPRARREVDSHGSSKPADAGSNPAGRICRHSPTGRGTTFKPSTGLGSNPSGGIIKRSGAMREYSLWYSFKILFHEYSGRCLMFICILALVVAILFIPSPQRRRELKCTHDWHHVQHYRWSRVGNRDDSHNQTFISENGPFELQTVVDSLCLNCGMTRRRR